MGLNKMDKLHKWVVVVFTCLILAVIVAADNGVFDDTNHNSYSIYGLTDVNTTNVKVDTIRLADDPTNHVINDNATCVIITGDTATLNIC